LNATEEMRQNL